MSQKSDLWGLLGSDPKGASLLIISLIMINLSSFLAHNGSHTGISYNFELVTFSNKWNYRPRILKLWFGFPNSMAIFRVDVDGLWSMKFLTETINFWLTIDSGPVPGLRVNLSFLSTNPCYHLWIEVSETESGYADWIFWTVSFRDISLITLSRITCFRCFYWQIYPLLERN